MGNVLYRRHGWHFCAEGIFSALDPACLV